MNWPDAELNVQVDEAPAPARQNYDDTDPRPGRPTHPRPIRKGEVRTVDDTI